MLNRLLHWLPTRPRASVENRTEDEGVPNEGVRIVDGLIRPNYACQSEIAAQCNLSCRDCNHLSPLAKKGFADPEVLYRDYSILAKVYRPELIYLTGGEPLLHPDVVGAVEAVRSSGIAPRIRILTNGTLLPRMSEAFWRSIDELEISLYPSSNIAPEQVAEWKAIAGQRGIKLEIFRFTEFRRSFSTVAFQDEGLMRRVYAACKTAHVWGCHYVADGWMYRCPQSLFLPRMLDLPQTEHRRDGIELREAPDFQGALFNFLTSSEPLAGCRNCLGNAGATRAHVDVPRREWRATQGDSIEALVDHEELARIESEMHIRRRDHIKDYV